MVRAAEYKRRYELFYKALKVSFATFALVLGFIGLIFVANFMLASARSIGSIVTGPGSRGSSASDLVEAVIWIFTIFVGAMIAVAYSIYVMDTLRSRHALGGSDDELI